MRSSRWMTVLAAALLCVLLLAGCGNDKQLSGHVTQLEWNADGSAAGFVLTDDGQRQGVLLNAESQVLSLVDGMTPELFLTGDFSDVAVSVSYSGGRQTLTTADGQMDAVEAEVVSILEWTEPDGAILADGTALDICHSATMTAYTLKDGAVLLTAETPLGPEVALPELDEAAQEAILDYYQTKGLRYDISAALEAAWSAWQQGGAEDGTVTGLSQSTTVTGISDRYVFCTTVVSGASDAVPVSGQVFDRATGTRVSAWELFSCAPEAAVEAIANASSLPETLAAGLAEDCVVFTPETLEVYVGNDCYTVAYESLEPILQPGVVPEAHER